MSPQNNCCETWVEKTQNNGLEYLPYKFTAKELDEETGLYYYGARYLDPKYSMWISTDPALGDYIPKAPINEEAKKHNQNLPGMGGVFNHINGDLYAYAGNNPVKYTDPDGNEIIALKSFLLQDNALNENLQMGSMKTDAWDKNGVLRENTVGRYGCLFTCAVNVGNTICKRNGLISNNIQLSELSSNDNYFMYVPSGTGLGTDVITGTEQIKNLLKDMTGKSFSVERYRTSSVARTLITLASKNYIKDSYIIADVGGHFINIEGFDSEGRLLYFDPSMRNEKSYDLNDIRGIYLMQEHE